MEGPWAAEPLVSVIVVNYNTRDLLRQCLASLEESTVSREVLVVDNASTDGSAEMVEREFPAVRLTRNLTNEKFARPNNAAMRAARGRLFLLLNSDAALFRGALETLARRLLQDETIGAVGPQLIHPNGAIQRSCRGRMTLWSHFCDMTALDRLFPRSRLLAGSEMTWFDHDSPREVEHLMAAALLVRRETVERVGLLDERLTIYFNDMDWSIRMRRAGWKILYEPQARALHHGGMTTRPLDGRSEIFREQAQNLFYFYRKYYGPGGLLLFRVLLALGFLARLVFWSLRFLLHPSEDSARSLRFARRVVGAACTLGGIGSPGEDPRL